MRTVTGETWEPTIGKITEVQGWVGNVYRTKSGWWGAPANFREPKQLFTTRADAIRYVKEAADRGVLPG